MRKGILEYCILSIISRQDAYASVIINELKAAEMIVVEGTLYPILTRLKIRNCSPTVGKSRHRVHHANITRFQNKGPNTSRPSTMRGKSLLPKSIRSETELSKRSDLSSMLTVEELSVATIQRRMSRRRREITLLTCSGSNPQFKTPSHARQPISCLQMTKTEQQYCSSLSSIQ